MDIDIRPIAIKFALIFFNLAVMVCGFVALSLGIYDKSDIAPSAFLVHDDIDGILWVTTITIVLGILIIFSTIFGYFSTLVDKSMFMIAFALTLCSLILAQTTAGTAFLVLIRDENLVQNRTEEMFYKLFRRYNNDSTEATRNMTDYIHQHLQCCGMGKDDVWGSDYPQSCKDPYTSVTHSEACQKKFANQLLQSTKKLSFLLLVSAGIEIIITLLCAAYLAMAWPCQIS